MNIVFYFKEIYVCQLKPYNLTAYVMFPKINLTGTSYINMIIV